MKKPVLLFCFLLIGFYSYTQSAQEDDKAVSERIFIHTDKSTCIAGDTIWYKAYLFDGHVPGSFSTNLFVELIDEKGIVLFTHKLPVFEGMAYGNFEVGDSLQHGYYFLRAYTPQLLQSGKQILPSKLIAVLNPSFIPEKYTTNPITSYNVQFYPESGQLVSGLTNTVAFTLITPTAQLSNAALLVSNSKNDTVVFAANNINGTGSFSFVPSINEKYKAELVLQGNEKKEFNLPAIQSSGVLLSVADNSKGKIYLVQKTSDLFKNNEAMLTGVMFDKIVFRQPLKFDNNESNGIIPLTKLPPGILHLSVTDADEKAYAMRHVVIYKPDMQAELIFKKDTINLSSKAKNVITVGLPDSTEGNFSVAVTVVDNIDAVNGNNSIINSVLINAESSSPELDLRGIQANPEEKSANDLVAITGNWIQPIVKKATEAPLQDNYITHSGRVFKYGSKKLVTKGNLVVMMRTKDSSSSFIKLPVSNDGRFVMDGLVYDDTARFHFQPDDKKTGKVEVTLDKVVELKVPAFTAPSLASSLTERLSFTKPEIKKEIAAVKTYIEKTKEEYKLLENVTVRAVRKKPAEMVNRKYASGLFNSMGNVRLFDFVNEPPQGGAQNIFQYLQGRVPGLRIDWRGGSNYSLTTSRAMSLTGGPIPVQVYLNEVEVDVQALLSVSIKDIALVKYFPAGTNAMFGFGVAGRLAIWTKQPDDYSVAELGHDNFFLAPGYTASQQFTQPDYSNGVFTKEDKRKTVYWNPNINITSEEREVKIRFFNSDNAKKLRVVIQGFTYDGRFIDFEKIIE
ncbi:MAG: hypothetical protein E6H07_06540 [Bacteroidetes bacterium]|nr:MAG: hypothetical protein E6H07_06540 [Bacteroidota bacterium]